MAEELTSNGKLDSEGEEEVKRPLLSLPTWGRWASAGVCGALAIGHLIWPHLAIDAITIGLLGGGFVIAFFDIDSLEVHGIKASRRRLAKQTRSVREAAIPPETIVLTPEPLLPSPRDDESEAVATQPDAEAEGAQLTTDLFTTVEQIRRELILLAGSAGRLRRRQPFERYSIISLASTLDRFGLIPHELLDPVKTVVEQRNVLAHGVFGPRVIGNSANTLAKEILSKLRSIKRETAHVVQAPLDLYADDGLARLRPERGVLLEIRNANGERIHAAVYPTDTTYTAGRMVTWEWDPERGIDTPTWYRDPVTGQATSAFLSASFFAGREYPIDWIL